MVRLYCACPLKKNVILSLEGDQVHYVQHVLRLNLGASVIIFNGKDGEWKATITNVSKKNILVTLISCIKEPFSSPSVHLIFTPLKQDSLFYLIEKSTELGVTHLHPVMTDRCNSGRFNTDKWVRNSIEASQQCERLEPPCFLPLRHLKDLLQKWSPPIPILCALERSNAPLISSTLARFSASQELGFLIGPEGGFNPNEVEFLKKHPFIYPVSLGPRILRAETAAVAALTCFQSTIGDWSS